MNESRTEPACVVFDDEDLAQAMREMESFVDVTPEDLQEICRAFSTPSSPPASAHSSSWRSPSR